MRCAPRMQILSRNSKKSRLSGVLGMRFLHGAPLRNIDYRDFPFSLPRSSSASSSPSPPPHHSDLNVCLAYVTRNNPETKIRRALALGMVHPADDSPIIRSLLKFDLIASRDRRRRRRSSTSGTQRRRIHLHGRRNNRRPGRCVTTPLLRVPAPRLSKPRGIRAD